jgi:hypothetical protein
MAKDPLRKNAPYKPGELEVILSLPPTSANIRWLALLLERSEDAIAFVYRIAFEHGRLGKKARVQERKIMEAKRAVGIGIGRKRTRTPER